MGQIKSRIKGIKFKYAADNIYSYHDNDFLKLVPEPENTYDKNAIAIYDKNNHHIGYVGKEINVEVLRIMRDFSYNCYISEVYYDNETPSIEFTLDYFEKNKTDDFDPYDIFEEKSIKIANKDPFPKNHSMYKMSYDEYYNFLNELKKFNSKIIYVSHEKFGNGKVIFVSKDFITVKFDSVGDKTFKYPESINVHLFKVK